MQSRKLRSKSRGRVNITLIASIRPMVSAAQMSLKASDDLAAARSSNSPTLYLSAMAYNRA